MQHANVLLSYDKCGRECERVGVVYMTVYTTCGEATIDPAAHCCPTVLSADRLRYIM